MHHGKVQVMYTKIKQGKGIYNNSLTRYRTEWIGIENAQSGQVETWARSISRALEEALS